MTNPERQSNGSGGGRELVVLVIGMGVIAAAATLATHWVRTRGVEAAGERGPAAVAAPEAPETARNAAAAAPPEVVHADIYFDFKSTRLRADAVRLLQDKARLVGGTSPWVVLVQGYADRRGPAEYNRQLARQRAEAVKQFLVELGVPEATIKVVTIGQDGATCDEPSAQCQQLDRRVHLEMRSAMRTAGGPVRAVSAQGDDVKPASGDEVKPARKAGDMP